MPIPHECETLSPESLDLGLLLCYYLLILQALQRVFKLGSTPLAKTCVHSHTVSVAAGQWSRSCFGSYGTLVRHVTENKQLSVMLKSRRTLQDSLHTQGGIQKDLEEVAVLEIAGRFHTWPEGGRSYASKYFLIFS